MTKKEITGLGTGIKKYIGLNVLFQWIGMCSSVVMVYIIAHFGFRVKTIES